MTISIMNTVGRALLPIALALLIVQTPASLVAQEWEILDPSPIPGRDHPIGFSYDGFGYAMTGQNNGIHKDVWKYDPSTDTWTQLPDYPGEERGFSIGDMNGDKGYFGFGYGSDFQTLNDLWVFDAPTETFEQLSNCPCTPRAHPAFVNWGDKIYMGLGTSTSGNMGDWWEYDIPTDTWTEKTTFPGADRHHPYQFAIGDYVYVGSGHQSDWYRYDPINDSWTQIATHPSYVRVAGIQFAYNGKGYTLSGVGHLDGDFHNPFPTGEFFEYDPEFDTWTELPPHPGMSRWASAYFMIDGYIYVVAGEVYDGTSEVYRYFLGEEITSIEESSAERLSLFPMPFEDHIILPVGHQWQAAQLYDIRGQLMATPSPTDGRLDMPGLSPGIYVLEVRDDESTFRQRVVKQ